MCNGPRTSKNQKKKFRAFQLLGFKIEIISNLKVGNFLDITFSLSENSFKSFYKSKNPRLCNSIHPRSIIRQILIVVNIRNNRLTSNKEKNSENNRIYYKALKKESKQRLEYLECLKDNVETCNHENNDNNSVKNKNINNCNSSRRNVNGATNTWLNNTSEKT